MAIKHSTTKTAGERGYVTDWNAEHVVTEPNTAKKSRTLIVAASDSYDTGRADYVCDGTADEVQINQAIADLPASGGCIMLLDGTYNIANTITITKDKTTLQGQGNSTTLLSSAAGMTLMMLGRTDCTIKSIKVQFSGVTPIGIYMSGCVRTKILEMHITGFGIGIQVNAGSYTEILSNYVYAGGYGITLQTAVTCTVSDNMIYTLGLDVYILTNANYNIIANNQYKGNIVVNDASCNKNLIHGNVGDGTILDAGTNTTIADNVQY